MNFNEYAAKPLLAKHGIAVPNSQLVDSADAAADAAKTLGACVIKAQVPTGKRGKAGGIKLAADAQQASDYATQILGMSIDGWPVTHVLVEQQIPIKHEYYAAVLNDHATCSPTLLFSIYGGMDVEEVAATAPDAMNRISISITEGIDVDLVNNMLESLELGAAQSKIYDTLIRLYDVYRKNDAELVEINPLVLTEDGSIIALDCKLTLDDSAAPRHEALAATASDERRTTLEARAADVDLKYIELDGSVGVLANGAGLTMTTMDMVAHFGGRPANFMEIGGEAYTKATTALGIVLDNPNIKSLVVNFCGAFARTDVMTQGVVKAWQELRPTIPVFFTIHGTGADEAVALVKEQLSLEPFEFTDDAVKAAVDAANAATSGSTR